VTDTQKRLAERLGLVEQSNDVWLHSETKEKLWGHLGLSGKLWRELVSTTERLERLERGEYICQKCHLRKDAEFEEGKF
jgi:hypothetical protein